METLKHTNILRQQKLNSHISSYNCFSVGGFPAVADCLPHAPFSFLLAPPFLFFFKINMGACK